MTIALITSSVIGFFRNSERPGVRQKPSLSGDWEENWMKPRTADRARARSVFHCRDQENGEDLFLLTLSSRSLAKVAKKIRRDFVA